MAAERARRVLMTADAMGGVWTYTRELSDYLAARGMEVLVAVMGDAPREALNVPVAHNPLKLEWQDRGGEESGPLAVEWLRQLAGEFRPDVIHLNGYSQAAARWDVPVLVVAHSCVCSWWRAVHGAEAPAEWAGYRERVREGLRGADAVVAPSGAMRADLEIDNGLSRAAVQVIENATRAEGGDSERDRLIVASGRVWDEAKNLKMLERIAAELPWELKIAGGELMPGEMRALLERAGIFAHPALYEPFGLSVLEAARSGCALVLADIPSLRELWRGAAAFVNPRDERAWVAALVALTKSRAMREEMAGRAHERSMEFTLERFGGRYVSLYEKLVNSRSRGAACA